MGSKRLTHLTSKWIKTKVLLRSSGVSHLVPETVRFTRDNLRAMLNKYGMVYVKPERGTYGKGVMRAEAGGVSGGPAYTYQSGTKIKSFGRFEAFYQSLRKATGGRSYLIQKGIVLLKHHGRRFDIRVMVQLSPKGRWETTGIIGRVADRGKIVTNYHSGGRPTAIEKLLSPHMDAAAMGETIRRLKKLGEDIGRIYYAKYPGFKKVGVDVGLDRTLTPWIIEVNTNPDPFIFNRLKDKTMYRRVMAYRRAQEQRTRKQAARSKA